MHRHLVHDAHTHSAWKCPAPPPSPHSHQLLGNALHHILGQALVVLQDLKQLALRKLCRRRRRGGGGGSVGGGGCKAGEGGGARQGKGGGE